MSPSRNGTGHLREKPFPVIDLFAGPGGLGEGFARWEGDGGERAFRIRLSIEKDRVARRTLLLRSFYRQFAPSEVPEAYYEYLRGRIDLDRLFDEHPDAAEAADREAWQAELGKVDHDLVRERIAVALGSAPSPWVLIGGPPCQAYSLAGRARILGEHRRRAVQSEAGPGAEYDPAAEFDRDHRHFLYREYLRIIADHRPEVFVMENVPGLLSSKVGGEPTINLIIRDLRRPAEALRQEGRQPGHEGPLEYRLYGLAGHSPDVFGEFVPGESDPRTFVVRAEAYGVPQARHRLLIVGVRSDLRGRPGALPGSHGALGVGEAIGDLPRLRSRLSRAADSAESWVGAVSSVEEQAWFSVIPPRVRGRMRNVIDKLKAQFEAGTLPDSRSTAPPGSPGVGEYRSWCNDKRLEHTCNHDARAHMREDLWRYLFASAYALEHGVAPKLRDFPHELLPNHGSAAAAAASKSGMFADRFRVQVGGLPATTVVSHIAKDGHYYIHPDPTQCRSLTVREAARLQSFPDNYFFEGNRTEQFTQVGNAVPPLLACRVAEVVYHFLRELLLERHTSLRSGHASSVTAPE